MAEPITVLVDADVAEFYRSVSDEERQKLNLLVNLRLLEATGAGKSLQEVMSEVSRNAQRRGLTSDILREILSEE